VRSHRWYRLHRDEAAGSNPGPATSTSIDYESSSYNPYIVSSLEAHAEALFAKAVELDIEGIVAKRLDAPHLSCSESDLTDNVRSD
jgi:hypothetical protein